MKQSKARGVLVSAAAGVRAELRMEETTLQEIFEGTVAVARGLEALQSEHESVLTDFYATEDLDSTVAGKRQLPSTTVQATLCV